MISKGDTKKMEKDKRRKNEKKNEKRQYCLTFLTSIAIPWYLKGFENSMYCALSLLIVNDATIKSAFPSTTSPTAPFHCLISLPLTWIGNNKIPLNMP